MACTSSNPYGVLLQELQSYFLILHFLLWDPSHREVLGIRSSMQNQVEVTASESKHTEAKKQYDVMVKNKQLELSMHLKEISQRKDQALFLAINDIRMKYEVEKLEIVNMEKEKILSEALSVATCLLVNLISDPFEPLV
ncbi:Synaptonemal complex protein 1 [Quillaja saponaria]|uniref:Synaptonemal complex protein 1 n=1 Tax=Quillaja saponaria TaxID=32244 RepID=A0AAD7LZ28_QUISA|nr:Synaptonemal complex protein 1 [Quillaja saponaria]